MNEVQTEKKPGYVVAVVSDLHIGSVLGLCPDEFILDGGGIYKPNKVQQEINHFWTNGYWREVLDKLNQTGYPLITIINGECVEGTRSLQVATSNFQSHIYNAKVLLEPIRNRSTHFFVLRGTPWHVLPSGQGDEAVAEGLGAYRNELGGSYSFYKLVLTVNGVLFDICHHVGSNTRAWTYGTSLRGEVVNTIHQYADAGKAPPQIVIRSHVHKYASTGDMFKRTTGYTTPAFQATTEYGHRYIRDFASDIGGLIFVIDADGRCQHYITMMSLPNIQEISL